MNVGGLFLGFITAMLWWYGVKEFMNQLAIMEQRPDYDAFGQHKSLIKKRLKIIFAIQVVIGLLLIKWTLQLLGSDD